MKNFFFVAVTLSFCTFSHSAKTDQDLIVEECTPMAETVIKASRARQAGIKKETFYADLKNNYPYGDWEFRHGGIDVAVDEAFSVPVKATTAEKEAATRAVFDKVFDACIDVTSKMYK